MSIVKKWCCHNSWPLRVYPVAEIDRRGSSLETHLALTNSGLAFLLHTIRKPSLVARPPEVPPLPHVNLLVVRSSDVAGVYLTVGGINRKPKRITVSERPHLRSIRPRTSGIEERVSRHTFARIGIHAHNTARHRVEILRVERYGGGEIVVGAVSDTCHKHTIGPKHEGSRGMRERVGRDAILNRGSRHREPRHARCALRIRYLSR